MSGVDMAALRRSKLDQNDTGNARRMRDHALGLMFMVDELESWVAFDGIRWTVAQGNAAAGAYSQLTMDGIFDEIRALRMAESEQLSEVFGPKFSSEMRDNLCSSLYTWAVKSGDMARLNGMLKAAALLRDDADKGGRFLFRATLDEFDAEPLAYHVSNGVIRFEPGEGGQWLCHFTPGHRAADMMMQVANVAYDARARAPHWTERMGIMHGDPQQQEALARIYGSTLTALTSDQAFYVFQGKGGDGKSATNAIIGDMHGDYFLTTSPKTFLEGPQQSGSAHQSDIVRLRGDIRMVVCDEPRARSIWDGERIKQVTGSRIVARGVNAKTEITYRAHWKLIVECNILPKAPSDDRGFRRRFKLYIWKVQFGVTPGVPDAPIHVVEKRLRAESSGILNWMIAGALRWLEAAVIPEPEMSQRATASFWSTASRMAEFIEAKCDLGDPEARIQATELYQAFKQFCIDQGDKDDKIITSTSFGTNLNNMQVYSVKNGRGTKDRVGIRWKDDVGVGAQAAFASGDGDWGDFPPSSSLPSASSLAGDFGAFDG